MDQPAVNQKEAEGTLYLPSPDVVAAAHVKEYETLYQRSLARPAGLLGRARRGAGMVSKVGPGAGRQQPALLQMVRRRQDQHRAQRPGPPPEDLSQEQAGADLGRRAGRCAHFLLLFPAPRSVQIRQRAAQHGREEGRYRHHLHAAHPRAGDRHAGYAKIGAMHSVVYGGFSVEGAGRAHRRRPEPRADHRRRRLAARQDRPAEGYRRRSHGPPADHRDRASWSSAPGRTSTWKPGAITGTTT